MNEGSADLYSVRDNDRLPERVIYERLLNRPIPGKGPFPEPQESFYRIYHLRTTVEFQKRHWGWAAGLAGTLCIGALFFTGDEQPVLLKGFSVIAGAILLSVSGVMFSVLSPYQNIINSVAATIGLITMYITGLVLTGSEVHERLSEYAVIFITVAMFTIARIPYKQAFVWGFGALMVAVIVRKWLLPESEWVEFFYYGGGSLVLGVLLGYAQDIRERTVFLQETLLSIEKVELEKYSRELARVSREDKLTGLPNRRYFDDVIKGHWNSALREGRCVNLIFIDVDYFKIFNDYYGHQLGDECLKRIGHTLAHQTQRASDFVARYGGEEFVAFFVNTNREGLEIIARRIIADIDALCIPHAQSPIADHVTLSIGVADMVPARYDSAEVLIRTADDALYRAKERGRHCYVTSWEEETAGSGKSGEA